MHEETNAYLILDCFYEKGIGQKAKGFYAIIN